MATPPNTPPPGGPFPPGDPRNSGPFSPDPRVRKEQERVWVQAQRDQVNAQRHQAKAWEKYHREASKQQVRMARQQAKVAAEAQRAQIRAFRQSTRTQSVIGPILLIGIAVVALLVYNGKVPVLNLLNWFARWWPLILIGAGILRLIEWGIARYTSQKRGVPVRFAIGGGTIFLLVLISLTGLAAQGGVRHVGNGWNFGWNGDDLNQFFGTKHEEDAAAVTHTVADDGTLEIHNDHGDVTVDGTSDDGLIHLTEHKEVYANNDDRASSLMSDLNPQFSGTDSNLILRVASSDRSSASLNLVVPRGVHVVLNSNHGDASVHGFQAPVSINANRGDVDVSGIAAAVQVRTNSRHGTVQVHSVRGAVQIAGSGDEVNLNDIYGPITVNGDFFGSGHLQHISGPVTYNAGRINFSAQQVDGEVSFDSDDEFSASGATGPIAIRCRSRNISLDRVTGNIQVTNSSGNVDITAVAPVGAITVENRDGDVSLSLPGTAHFTLAADTSDGSVQSNFPGASTGQGNASHRGSFATTVGAGGPSIHLTTTHGNISLEPTDHVQMPRMPTVPALTALPADLNRGMKDMQKALAEAQKEGDQARVEGLKEAERARAEAEKEAAQARAEGLKAAAEARAEAAQARAEGLREAAQQRKEAEQERQQQLRESDQERKQALAEAARERQQALREAQRARQEADRERRQSTPNTPSTPQ